MGMSDDGDDAALADEEERKDASVPDRRAKLK